MAETRITRRSLVAASAVLATVPAMAATAQPDPLVELDRRLTDAERAYNVIIDQREALPRGGDPAAKARLDAASEYARDRVEEILEQMQATPITSMAGAAAVMRCISYAVDATCMEGDCAFMAALMTWIGQQTGRDETTGGLCLPEYRA